MAEATGWVRAWAIERDARREASGEFDVNRFRRDFRAALRAEPSSTAATLAELDYDTVLVLPEGIKPKWTPVRWEGHEGFVRSQDVVEIGYVKKVGVDLSGRSFLAAVKAKRDLRSRGNATRTKLLWGDLVQIISRYEESCYVRARGWFGYIASDRLTPQPLLDVYVVDVGQGDGVLVRDTEGRHILIDGGLARRFQQSGKNAADFVDWKFHADYGHHAIHLDAMVASHCDADHFGGLKDLVAPSRADREELDVGSVSVNAFYHAGLSYWQVRQEDRSEYPDQLSSSDKKWLGPSVDWPGTTSQPNGGFVHSQHESRVQPKVKTWLLGGTEDYLAAAKRDADPALGGEWRNFLRGLRKARVKQAYRLGVDHERIETPVYMPGWEPGQTQTPIRVLGPVTVLHEGSPALPDFEANSQNTNGHSVLLRIDYGAARILMTGDLNKNSMDWLVAAHGENSAVFQSDVAKGCHHGSSDISYKFLEHVAASATVISSGDAEGYAHPRPEVVGASAMTGHKTVVDDRLVTPLVYMTEVERSISVGKIKQVRFSNYPDDEGRIEGALFAEVYTGKDPDLMAWWEAYSNAGAGADVDFTYQKELWTTVPRDIELEGARIMRKVHYGLVNIRTDGDIVMCATMKESGGGWTVHAFHARHGQQS